MYATVKPVRLVKFPIDLRLTKEQFEDMRGQIADMLAVDTSIYMVGVFVDQGEVVVFPFNFGDSVEKAITNYRALHRRQKSRDKVITDLADFLQFMTVITIAINHGDPHSAEKDIHEQVTLNLHGDVTADDPKAKLASAMLEYMMATDIEAAAQHIVHLKAAFGDILASRFDGPAKEDVPTEE